MRIKYFLLSVCCLFALFTLYNSTRFASAHIEPFPSSSSEIAKMNVIEANNGGQNFQVGQQIDSILSVSNQEATRSITGASRITVIDMLPAGLANLRSTGVNWRITLSASTGPATLIAVYTGPYPFMPGSVLPPIILSCIFTTPAMPGIASSALLGMSNDDGPLRIVSTYTVHISVSAPRLIQTPSKILLPRLFDPYSTPASNAIFYPGLPHTDY